VDVLEVAFREGIGRLRAQASESTSAYVKQVVDLMTDAIHAANAKIVKASRENPECEGMGTTLVAALVHDDSITIAHVGDSRAYRLRNNVLERLTSDHSLLQEQIDAGLISADDARLSVHRNLVTRAVGIDARMVAEIHTHQTRQGDKYMLCSDGLSDMVDDGGIRDLLAIERSSLAETCVALVNRANENGGHDNISVLLMSIRRTDTDGRTFFEKVLGWLG
jgi:serine/threonine protein phosphatase PrpC